MISLPRLARQAASGHYEQMLESVVHRSRALPLAVRLRLSEQEVLPAAALGLALRGVCELTYRPTPTSIALLRRLMDLQCDDGSFGEPSATATALSGLLGVLDQLGTLPGPAAPRFIDEEVEARLRLACDRALESLRECQDRADAEALFGEVGALIGDEIDSAIVIWQLGLEPRFARAIRLHDLLHAIDARGLRHGRSTAQLVGRSGRDGARKRRARNEARELVSAA